MGSTPRSSAVRTFLSVAVPLIVLVSGAGVAGCSTSPDAAPAATRAAASPSDNSAPASTSAKQEPEPPPSAQTPCLPASAPQPEAAQAAEAGPQRTGRLCLMALGTNPHYRLREGGPVDLVIVSPEDKAKQVLAQARRDHPDTPVFAYLNSMDIMMSRVPEGAGFWKQHEDWFLHEASGQRMSVRVQSYRGPNARFAMNIANPGWQEYLGKRAVEFFEMGYDGLQLDNVETDYSYRPMQVGRFISALPMEMNEEKWYAGEVAMLARVKDVAKAAGFGEREIIFNHIRAGEPDRAMEYLAPVDGANAESWMDRKVPPDGKWGWRARVDLARRAAVAGKRTNLLCIASNLSREEGLFVFASYLMAFEGERNTLWYGRPYRPEDMPWYEFYDADLGRPSGEMQALAGSPVYRRDFEKGAVLANPTDRALTVDLGGSFWNETFDEIKEVMLPGKSGAILLKAGADVPPRIVVEAEACVPGSSFGASGGPLTRVANPLMSGQAGVEFSGAAATCTLPAEVPAGRYRLVLDGAGKGREADAVGVTIGPETRRAVFDLGSRAVFSLSLAAPATRIELKPIEPGVIVDRVTLVRLPGR